MISVENSAALVKGAAPSAPKIVKLTVTRSFYVAGIRKDVGDVVEVPEQQARELTSLGKAIAYVEKPAAPRKAPPKEKPE